MLTLCKWYGWSLPDVRAMKIKDVRMAERFMAEISKEQERAQRQ